MSRRPTVKKRAPKRKPKRTKSSSGGMVDEFLERVALIPSRGSCTVCKHPKRKEIEADCYRYLDHLKRGKTHITFGVFVRGYLRDAYDIPGWAHGPARHMERCCGANIKA